MSDRLLAHPGAAAHAAAVRSMHGALVRREIELEEAPAPSRLAPHAAALTAEVVGQDDDELASGRFVLLHDLAEPEPWGGSWRIVSFARAVLDDVLTDDPLLSDIAWTWLREAFERRGAEHVALAGTVTRIVNERFGELAGEPAGVELEVRASWTPQNLPDDAAAHVLAWTDLLAQLAGLPPVHDGITGLPGVKW